MTRFTWLAALAASFAVAAPAAAESQQEIAERLNAEGNQLMYKGEFEAASAKYADAAARIPDARYFFNLCASRYREGKFGLALTACNAAESHSPSATTLDNIQKVTEKIRSDARDQGIEIQVVGGGSGPDAPPPDGTPADPGTVGAQPPGTTTPTYTSAVGRPSMQQGLFTATRPDHRYTWTLGFDVFGGVGTIGEDGYYGSAAGGFRIKGDYLLDPSSRLGAQFYGQLSSFTEGEDQMGTDPYTLSIVDVGAALYKHFCVAESLCVTPLAGLHLALMSPGNEQSSTGETVFNYSALGARLEMGAHYAFGARLEHVLGVSLGTNIYSPVFSERMDGGPSAAALGLDTAGAAGYVSVGYTYRFNTPFGRSPFITLQ